MSSSETFNPQLDLILERTVDLPAEAIWKAWTTPELLMPWFCPKPWRTTECTIDLRPGGLFHNVMQGPEPGQKFDNNGCYLEIVPDRKLVWTSAMGPEFRPHPHSPEGFPFTVKIELEPCEAGTIYRVTALHADEAAKSRHEAMGFEQGWGKALDQMIEFLKSKGL